jgi:hypothetical protein
MGKLDSLELINIPQELFDSFNSFIMSNDKKVFNKLISKSLLYDKVKDIPGDIVECGVFKGSGLYSFLKLKNIFNPNSSKKVIGFDFFNTNELISSIGHAYDKESMNRFFKDRGFEHGDTYKQYLEMNLLAHGFLPHEFNLIAGDVSITTKQFAADNPGFKISLLYMDLDLEVPTYDSLMNLWDSVTKGGIIVFDEYGYHKWSESKGVDRFIEEKNLEIKSLDFLCPTAYIKK